MEDDKKIDFCAELFAEDFKINYMTAKRIITWLDIEDKIFEYYEEEITNKENELEEEAEKEYQMNKDLFFNDIHGGV